MVKTNPFRIRDICFLTLLLIIGISLTVWVFFPSAPTQGILEVRVNGQLRMRLPLAQNTDREIFISNHTTNRFLIQDGTVRMTEANCHDRTCVRTRAISRSGESIVCLPHRLVLTSVETDETDSPPDAVTH